jgi:hypothetical protein
MSEPTTEQAAELKTGHCCFCHGSDFLEGPSGGMSVNVKCANKDCGAKFNLQFGDFSVVDIIGKPGEDKPYIPPVHLGFSIVRDKDIATHIGGSMFFSCDLCGSLVAEERTTKHREWHLATTWNGVTPHEGL